MAPADGGQTVKMNSYSWVHKIVKLPVRKRRQRKAQERASLMVTLEGGGLADLVVVELARFGNFPIGVASKGVSNRSKGGDTLSTRVPSGVMSKSLDVMDGCRVDCEPSSFTES